jgi:hypothetical protein
MGALLHPLLCDGKNRSCLTVAGKSSGLPTILRRQNAEAVNQSKRKRLVINSSDLSGGVNGSMQHPLTDYRTCPVSSTGT